MDILADGEAAVAHIGEVMTDATSLISQIGSIMVEHTALVAESDARLGGLAGRVRVARQLGDTLAKPAANLGLGSNQYFDDTRTLETMVDYVIAQILGDEDEDDETRVALVALVRHFLGLVTAADEGAAGTYLIEPLPEYSKHCS